MTPQRPNILFLVHRVPYPPNRGDRIRTFHFLQYLARRADVHLAFPITEPLPAETSEALNRICKQVAAFPVGRLRRWSKAAWSMLRGRTATEGLFQSSSLSRTISRWAAQVRFDTVVVCCSSMVQYLNSPELAGVPVFVDLIDVDSQKWFDYSAEIRNAKRWLYQIEGTRLRRLEGSLASRSKAIALTSRAEVELYRSFCPAKQVLAISNGVDLNYFQPTPNRVLSSSLKCVFVGALDYLANADGVQWFCDNVWPEIVRRTPDATFTIVGSHPTPTIRRLTERQGVQVAADVPDVRPYLSEATVVVVPLRIARGIQNKVLEAMAMGKPVIATPQALEGIDVQTGIHACQATTPQQWIEILASLFGDARTRERLGLAGRAFVETNHSWDRMLQPLAALLKLNAPEVEPA